MAFGDLKGTLTGNGSNIAATNALTGSVSVAVGDLIVVAFTEATALTATGATDNLGNTYTPFSAGVDAGTTTGRGFYSAVTVAGTLTSITVAASASIDDYSGFVAVFAGPFASSPLDVNPATNADASTPFAFPATGTLAQADELVVCYGSMNNSAAYVATSPLLLAGQAVAPDGSRRSVIGYQVVASTSSVSPVFTASGGSTAATNGTASFMKGAAGTAYNQSVLASTTPSPLLARVSGKFVLASSSPDPSLARAMGKFVLVSLTPVASLARSTGKSARTSTTPVATLARSTGKLALVSTTPAPSLSALGVRLRLVLATSTPVASLARSMGKLALAATIPVGAVSRALGKAIAASVTPGPSLGAVKSGVLAQTVQAITIPVASLARQMATALRTSTTPVPSLLRQIVKALRTSTTPVPSLAATFAVLKSLLVSTVPVPRLSRQIGKAVAATTTPVPRLFRQIGKLVLAATSPVAGIARAVPKVLLASTTPLAGIVRARGIVLRAVAMALARLEAVSIGPVKVDPKYLLALAARVRHAFPAYVRGLAGNVTRSHRK